MSNLPDDLGKKPKSNTEATSTPESNRPAEPTAKGETVRERVTRKIIENPRWSEAKPSGKGFVIVGARPSSRKATAFEKTLLTTLRQDEPTLGNLTVTDRNWLTVALAHLIQIDESRRAENAHGSSYCIFETGRAYFQCLAPSFGTYLRCESVSEKFVPEMGAVLTPEKRNQLVQEFGFAAPGYLKNFSQKIDIMSKEDLAFVARMAFRVLRDIYDVTDFGATKFKVSIPEPAKPVSTQIHDYR